jgi:hypothetical protein
MKLITPLHPVPRLRMSGAVLLVPPCAFMVWTLVKFYTRDIPTALIVNYPFWRGVTKNTLHSKTIFKIKISLFVNIL